MSDDNKIYKGDVGTDFLIDAGEDISTATLQNLSIETPEGAVVTWTGSKYTGDAIEYPDESGNIITAPANQVIEYTTVEGDLPEAGKYKAQAVVALPSWSGRGNTFEFVVYDHFK